jgi:5-methylcytosine-specific restriction endonuclease McrA
MNRLQTVSAVAYNQRGANYMAENNAIISPSDFKRRAGNIYRGMVKAGEPQFRGHILIDPGYNLPFTEHLFAQWLMREIGLSAKKCRYCESIITALTCQVDHMHPKSRGGSLTFENLTTCCVDCNKLKGDLRADEFEALLSLMRSFRDPYGAGVLRRRLIDGGVAHAQRIAVYRAKRGIHQQRRLERTLEKVQRTA